MRVVTDLLLSSEHDVLQKPNVPKILSVQKAYRSLSEGSRGSPLKKGLYLVSPERKRCIKHQHPS